MISDDAIEDGAYLARKSLFVSYWSGNTYAGRALHSLTVRIRNEGPNRVVRRSPAPNVPKVAKNHDCVM